MGSTAVLDRSRSIAPPDYDRWRVPPSALAIYLAAGQLFALNAFDVPLTRIFGVTSSEPGDWTATTIGWLFPIAISALGLSAFVFGRWVDDAGPRKAMFASAVCFGGGFIVAALGVALHNIWIVYLGYGVLGGVGLGIGYISPTTALIKWFPDRPAAATGLAIAGFSVGAMLGAALAETLLGFFSSPTDSGVVPTLVAMGMAYGALMAYGAATVRLPAPGWTPKTYTSARRTTHGTEGAGAPKAWAPRVGTPAGRSDSERRPVAKDVHAATAVRTRQFWLVWLVLCLMIMVGSGLMTEASAIIRAFFPVLIGARAATGFAALLGIAVAIGGCAWSVASDDVGRRRIYMAYLFTGAIALAFLPTAAAMGSVAVFTTAAVVAASVYGGGFATAPTYARDLFGDMHVGAIHGRLLTAWPVAAIAGPLAWDAVRDFAQGTGRSVAHASEVTIYAMAAILMFAAAVNWFVSSVDAAHHHRAPGSDDAATATHRAGRR